MKKFVISCFALSLFWTSCGSKKDFKKEADKFISEYSGQYQKLYSISSEAEWASNTHIVEGDSTNAVRTRKANEAIAAFTGSAENIKTTQELLEHKADLSELQVKQLEAILYRAANNPQTVKDVVSKRIKAETEQTEKLYGFTYKLNGKAVTTNQLDSILKAETNIQKRLQAWEASKEVGKTLKSGLVNLRKLRNETVQALGYDDYFTYQASEYGMKRQEMMDLVQKINQELLPLYRELHTYARYELAKKYGVKEVPDYLPAHWLPNRFGQDWSSMVDVKGINLDKVLQPKGAQQLMDGTWLNFSFASVKGLPFSSWSHLLLLAAGIAAVMVLGVAAMRLITRPIERLAVAAEELGKGARPGDVPEAGLNEVRAAARAFNRMQRRIRRMIEDRTQMIAAISHDLRTPITRLRLRAEFVEDAEEQQKMLADLDQMEAIIRSTLAFAREDSDSEPTSAVDVVALLQDVADGHPPARFNATRDGRGILKARPVALRRCFDNLVANAVRYGRGAEIAIHDLPDAIEVVIDDSGPGIPPERLKDVFRPFVRLEESRNRESGGVGLGLAIARSVVLAHGGTIALTNRPEGGLRATVRLPKGE